MSVIVECNANENGPLNTGAKEQCYLGVTTRYAFCPDPTWGFEALEDLKDKEKWDKAIAAKHIYPLYDAEEYAVADTEDQFFEGQRKQYKTADGKKIRTFRSVIGLCSYKALKSHSGKAGRVFEFTEDPGIKAVQSESKFKGQKATLDVGKLQDTIAGTPQSTIVTVNYTDEREYTNNGVNVRLDGWGDQDVFGIFDVSLVQTSASATSIKFKAFAGCGTGESLRSLIESDVVLKDATGAIQDVSFVEPDSDGIYELKGTGFANGFKLSLNGVVDKQGGVAYESPESLTIKLG